MITGDRPPTVTLLSQPALLDFELADNLDLDSAATHSNIELSYPTSGIVPGGSDGDEASAAARRDRSRSQPPAPMSQGNGSC